MECKTHTLVAHVAALHHSSALLVKYRVGPDNQEGWFLPNGDLHHLEHPEQAVRRILKEQAGIDDAAMKLAEIESFMGNNQTWHLIFSLHANHERLTWEDSCRVEMVRDRQAAAGRRLCSPRLGKIGPGQTRPSKSAVSVNV